LSWKHSGFRHHLVRIEPLDVVVGPPVVAPAFGRSLTSARSGSISSRSWLTGARMRYRTSRSDAAASSRIIAQIPEPRKHLIHSYGRYANAARAKREGDGVAGEGASQAATAAAPGSVTSEPDSAERKAARKRWANLIRHIYEVDPLVCPRCGGMMKIIAFITEPRVIRAILDSARRTGTPSVAGSRHPPPPARPAADGVQ
jgi:hypothetical protein